MKVKLYEILQGKEPSDTMRAALQCLQRGQKMTTDREDSMLSEIEGNRSHWKYSLNTRGLILLVLGIVEEEKRENGRVKNVEISNILEDSSENFKKDFPYLMCYNEIKEIYDELAKKEKRYEYFSGSPFETSCFRTAEHY